MLGFGGERDALKSAVKVVRSQEQKDILSELAKRLGTSENEMLHPALMDYAKDVCFVKQWLQ
jgi:hypothetical protein